MKVVHLTTENMYGAGRAAVRLNNALNHNGIDSKIMVLDYICNDTTVEQLKTNYIRKGLRVISDLLNQFFIKKWKNKGFFSGEVVGLNYLKEDAIQEADIIHIHWVNNGIWSHRFAKKLVVLNKPIVWTMHDMWPFTGGCHYCGECRKYEKRQLQISSKKI